jgi:hypothetical protein
MRRGVCCRRSGSIFSIYAFVFWRSEREFVTFFIGVVVDDDDDDDDDELMMIQICSMTILILMKMSLRVIVVVLLVSTQIRNSPRGK